MRTSGATCLSDSFTIKNPTKGVVLVQSGPNHDLIEN